MPADLPDGGARLPESRQYQIEMYEESLRRNILVVMPTGSGKTHIALLRLQYEAQMCPGKVSWFLAPRVYLCRQQFEFIEPIIPESILITGNQDPSHWKKPQLWHEVIQTHRVVVSTPQVLADALHHGYIVLGRDIGFLIFDEVHHAQGDNHPYSQIMRIFYPSHISRRLGPGPREPSIVHPGTDVEVVQPSILGLTATPVYRQQIQESAWLERLMDAQILAPMKHAEELANYVHRSQLQYVVYPKDPPFCSTNLETLRYAIDRLNIDEDPLVISMRATLSAIPNQETAEATTLRQELERLTTTQSTFVHKGLTSLVASAESICQEVGVWASDWFLFEMVQRLAHRPELTSDWASIFGWKPDETSYLKKVLGDLILTPPSYDEEDIVSDCSGKTNALIECLVKQKSEVLERSEETFTGLIFVEKRVTVAALAHVLKHHPTTKESFKVCHLVGATSTKPEDKKLSQIFATFFPESPEDTLSHFRDGEKDLLISTSVGEEGLDIPSCCSVVRWDLPRQGVALSQSRGRARTKESIFTMMLAEGDVKGQANTRDWEMINKVLDNLRETETRVRAIARSEIDLTQEIDSDMDDNAYQEKKTFKLASTGATLTLASAVSHLSHFCSKIPNTAHNNHVPMYEIEPSESSQSTYLAVKPYQGPFGAKVTLPRSLPISQRQFGVERVYASKHDAKRAVAFEAYKWLYEHGMLNEYLLPLSSVLEPEREEELVLLLSTAVGKRAATVGVGGQLNPWIADPSRPPDEWHESELQIGSLPSLRFFTKRRPVQWEASTGPQIYYAPFETPLPVSLRPLSVLADGSSPVLTSAREFTRRTFWNIYSTRMARDDANFAYLFTPRDGQYQDVIWSEYQSWAEGFHREAGLTDFDKTLVNAAAFGSRFQYPKNIVLVRNCFRNGRTYKFSHWQTEPISEEEQAKIHRRYRWKYPDFEIKYPLLAVESLLPRTNLCHPPTAKSKQHQQTRSLIYMAPEYSAISLTSPEEMHLAAVLPSVLRMIAMSTTLEVMRHSLWPTHPSLSTIPSSLLQTAMTCTSAQERESYERLEHLGDCVFKFVTTLQLLVQYPSWHEGYLTIKAQRILSNLNLAKKSIENSLFLYIIRDNLQLRRWKPQYLSSTDECEPMQTDAETKSPLEELSTKTLGDVVESLIGAAFHHGGIETSIDLCSFLQLGLPWRSAKSNVQTLLDKYESKAHTPTIPTQVQHVENILGYDFKCKTLIVEALTHSSFLGESELPSYERLEFLGDAVLDMVLVPYMHSVEGKKFSPGQITNMKTALISSFTLGFFCLAAHTTLSTAVPKKQPDESFISIIEPKAVYLWQCVSHTSPQLLDDQRAAFDRFELHREEISQAFRSGKIFPWNAILKIQVPKFFSDVLESVIGAVYLDSKGDMEAVRNILRHIGWYSLLERIGKDEIMAQHPVSDLGIWAGKNQRRLKYDFEVDEETMSIKCSVKINDKEYGSASALNQGKVSRSEVKLIAAEKTLQMLLNGG